MLEEYFQEPSRWCKGSLARRADNSSCVSTDPEVASRCVYGAILFLEKDVTKKHRLVTTLQERIAQRYPGQFKLVNTICIAYFNDDANTTITQIQEIVKGL